MYTWTILAITFGVVVVVFQLLLFLGLFMKARKREIVYREPTPMSKESPNKSLNFTDPYTGEAMSLERVSNASSLRSTRSVGFISYQKSEGGTTRGRQVTPLFGGGSLNSAKLNCSMTSLSSLSLDEEPKQIHVNPIFKEESKELKQIDKNPMFKGESQELKQMNVDPLFKKTIRYGKKPVKLRAKNI